jgi:hypothetical protein
MAVVASDIVSRLSVKTGSAGDSTSSTPADSLGKYMSTTAIVDGSLQNLFANVDGTDAETGKTYYRCYFKKNTNAVDTWSSVLVWILSQVPGGGDIAIGLDPAGVTAHDDASAQAADIADENTVPAGVTFSTPTTDVTALSVGDVGPLECFAIWVRLSVPAGAAALALDQVIIRCEGGNS